MTLKEIIAADRASVFLNTDEFAVSAVWTPAGGVAQPAISVLFRHQPIHGDEEGNYDVEQAEIWAVASSADVASVKLNDTIVINSTTYRIANNPFPDSTDGNWSVLMLTLPQGSETLI